MLLNPESEKELEEKSNIASKKIYDLFCEFSKRSIDSKKSKKCYFSFLMSPKELVGNPSLEKVVFEKNSLSGAPFKQSARGTGEIVELESGILFRSIGYQGVPIQDVPFHETRGIIPNEKGRVIDNENNVVPQFYTAGWIKRGPSGIIGTNRACSVETVTCLLEDLTKLDDGSRKSGAEVIFAILESKNIHHVSYDDWQKIDAKEIERGEPKGKPREKYTYIDEMLSAIE